MALPAHRPLRLARRHLGLLARPRPLVAFRRILVPLLESEQSAPATAIACRLAAEHGALVTAVAVVEVPAELPLDAHMDDEEARAKGLLRVARALAESYGVSIETRTVRGRRTGETIVEAAREARVDLVLLRAPRTKRASRRAPPFEPTVAFILKHAPCRVIVVAPPAQP